jgi:hypothetical protein
LYPAATTWIALSASLLHADAIARLKPDKLEAVHKAIQALRTDWHSLARSGRYREYRACLHVHSSLSHDSRGTVEEIVAAARATGTRVLMFTEHPAAHYDYYKDGHQGVRDGVLLIPGAETEGFLVFPTQSLRGLTTKTPQEFADLVRRQDGLIFLSHLEERMDWNIRGLTGVEIYNTHADLKDEKNLLAAMRNPLWIWKLADLARKYPQEVFSSIQDYPADYLRRWDQLYARAPHTGVAANDAHQNVGLVIRLVENGQLRLEDALGAKIFELDAGMVPALDTARKGKRAGDMIFQLRLDPYENSLRHVGTHLLLTELSEKGVWEALEVGRCFVALDWLADATGFDFAAWSGAQRHEMGELLPFADGVRFQARAPLPGQWRLLRDGEVITEATGRELNVPVTRPGNYRVEIWLTVAGEKKIWILSNPVYVRSATRPGR